MDATAHTLIVLSLAVLAIYAAILLALHLLPTGYSPLRDPVSLYTDGRYGPLYAPGADGGGRVRHGRGAPLAR